MKSTDTNLRPFKYISLNTPAYLTINVHTTTPSIGETRPIHWTLFVLRRPMYWSKERPLYNMESSKNKVLINSQ